MIFNSIDFAIFLPIVFGLYWFVLKKSIRLQNILIVAASYVFYGWWDARFLILIALSTLVDFWIGRALNSELDLSKRKLLLYASVAFNIGVLGFFKYYNFFVENFVEAFSFFGQNIASSSLDIVLPVGISFYTFQTMSYTIDVYHRRMTPVKDLTAFAAFVAFFPQLVAGPIERASNLLPQFFSKRRFDYRMAVDGARQVLWGLFKKVVVADNCAKFVDIIFSSSGEQPSGTLIFGAFLFAIQIYCDFSGYSDIAIGTSRFFGFNLKRNFAFPYFSRDIAEFWRRWHISLSTWFRDYVYIPLGGSRGSTLMQVRNIFIIFLVSGFWHGANWTFIIWGALHAAFFLPLLLLKRNRNHLEIVAQGGNLPRFRDILSMMMTFLLVLIGWVFFRADNLGHAIEILSRIIADPMGAVDFGLYYRFKYLLIPIAFMFLIEWWQRDKEHGLDFAIDCPAWSRRFVYLTVSIAILWFQGAGQDFIYFQF